MGSVYRATRGDDVAAMKLMHPGLAADPEFRRRFRREAVISQLAHGPRVARVIDFDAEAETPWLATELLDGTALATAVAAHGPLAPISLDGLATGMAEGLAMLHNEGILHRDVKPANVMLTSRGPVLVDFGIAAAAELTALTRSGMLMGSAGWMAPEQVAGAAAGPASDVFSWAATIAYAATGRHPFGTGAPEALLYRVTHADPDLDGITEPIRSLLVRALAKDPALRPDSAALPELWAQTQSGNLLATLLDEAPHAPTTALAGATTATAGFTTPMASFSKQQPRRRWGGLIALGTVAVVVLAVAGLLAWQLATRGDQQPVNLAATHSPKRPASSPSSHPTIPAVPAAAQTAATSPTPDTSPNTDGALKTYRAAIDPGSVKQVRRLGNWLNANLQQRVLLDITWTPTTNATFQPESTIGDDDQADMVEIIPRCAASFCSGGMELYLHDLNTDPDATFSGVGEIWNLTGTFVVQYNQVQNAGIDVVHLRAVPAAPTSDLSSDDQGGDGAPGVIPGVSACGTNEPVARPTQITLTCADDDAELIGIRWSVWTLDGAQGTGELKENNCDPDCADGSWITNPVTVVLSKVATTGNQPQFKKASVTYTSSRPADAPRTWTAQLPLWSGHH